MRVSSTIQCDLLPQCWDRKHEKSCSFHYSALWNNVVTTPFFPKWPKACSAPTKEARDAKNLLIMLFNVPWLGQAGAKGSSPRLHRVYGTAKNCGKKWPLYISQWQTLFSSDTRSMYLYCGCSCRYVTAVQKSLVALANLHRVAFFRLLFLSLSFQYFGTFEAHLYWEGRSRRWHTGEA